MGAIFRRAVARGEVAVNPTTGLELPAVRGRRDRIALPEEARQLLDALERDRALWATALYSGLRLGELRALEWDAIDFERGLVHARRTWDHIEGPVAPKSRAGKRSVPLAAVPTSRRTSSRAAGRTGSYSAGAPTRRSTRDGQQPRRPRLGERQARPHHPARVPPRLRVAHARRGVNAKELLDEFLSRRQ